jgi:hypothetical protein
MVDNDNSNIGGEKMKDNGYIRRHLRHGFYRHGGLFYLVCSHILGWGTKRFKSSILALSID